MVWFQLWTTINAMGGNRPRPASGPPWGPIRTCLFYSPITDWQHRSQFGDTFHSGASWQEASMCLICRTRGWMVSNHALRKLSLDLTPKSQLLVMVFVVMDVRYRTTCWEFPSANGCSDGKLLSRAIWEYILSGVRNFFLYEIVWLSYVKMVLWRVARVYRF